MPGTTTNAAMFDFEELGLATVAGSESYRLNAKHIDQAYLIDVALPPYPISPDQYLPVVYVLDGNGLFGLAAQTARLLQMGPYPLPAMLIVSIGYYKDPAENKPSRALALRNRDLSPSVDQDYLARFRAAPAPWTLPADIALGRADLFLAFIEEEVKPFIASRYAVDQEDQTLVGMSLGGLFVLHALFTRGHAFRRYIAMSPAIWWDKRMLFTEEAALADKADDLPAHLFLSAGSLEEEHDVGSRMVSGLHELEAALRGRNYPNLEISCQVFPDETHMSVCPAALSRGLTTVFGGHGNTSNWAKRLEE